MNGRRIEAWMAEFDVSEYHEHQIAARPEEVYAAFRRVDLATDPVVRLLFAARGLVRPGQRRTSTLDDFVAAGFTLLEEVADSEIVLGVTGRFWRFAEKPIRLTPDGFAAFAEPGWTQGVWNLHVAPAGDGSLVSTETRVRATDDAARRAFRRYWRLVGPFSAVIRRRLLALVAAEVHRAATEGDTIR